MPPLPLRHDTYYYPLVLLILPSLLVLLLLLLLLKWGGEYVCCLCTFGCNHQTLHLAGNVATHIVHVRTRSSKPKVKGTSDNLSNSAKLPISEDSAKLVPCQTLKRKPQVDQSSPCRFLDGASPRHDLAILKPRKPEARFVRFSVSSRSL